MNQQPQQTCDNCKKSFPQSKAATHFGYCRRNIKKCTKCGEMYDINFTEQHQEEFHKMASCRHCNKSFKPNQIPRHEGQCEARTEFCEYCDLDVPQKAYPAHLKECEARTKQCEKCRKPIANKDFLIHTISCPGMVEEPSITSSKYRNYDQFIKQAQRLQEPKRNERNEYKPTYQQPKRQSSKGGIERLGQRQRKPQPYSQNNLYTNNPVRPTEIKRDQQPIVKPSTIQNKPSTNYTDINMNKNLPQQRDRKAPNIGEKDKYGRSQVSRNVDSYKNLGSGKVIENRNVPTSKVTTTEYQPLVNPYGAKKPSIQVPSRANQPTITNPIGGLQLSTHGTKNRMVQPSSNYPKVPQTYKRQIPSNKQVYVRRQSDKPRQMQKRKQVNYAQLINKPQDDIYKFRKQETRKYQEPIRSEPIRSKPQTYAPTGQQYRPAEQPRSNVSPPQQNYTNTRTGDHQDDEQLQRAIMASLGNMSIDPRGGQSSKGSKKQPYKIDDIPAEFLENDMMNESFYGKQMALMQEIQKNKKKR